MERDHLENLDMDLGMILKWIFNKLLQDVDGIDLAQDTYNQRPVVHAVVNLCVHNIWEISCLADGQLFSKKELCSMQSVEKAHGRAGNRTRDLMVSSQEL